MPYEAIDEETYAAMAAKLRPLSLEAGGGAHAVEGAAESSGGVADAVTASGEEAGDVGAGTSQPPPPDAFCDNDSCEVRL